ncbi:hypothetical protein ACU635_14600 [[Actinomadura] parvosata]|uniref:hypothetical protein n=1 Tax=[Actinomadura] parvosata TaxID=1955412 RepID=UPI00406CDA41
MVLLQEIKATDLLTDINEKMKAGDGHPVEYKDRAIIGDLRLSRMRLSRALCFANCTFTGAVDLTATQADGDLIFVDCDMRGLNAPSLRTEGHLILQRVHNVGAISLMRGRLNGNLRCTGSTFEATDGPALDGRNLQVEGGVQLDEGFAAHGEITIVAAQIKGTINARGAQLRNPSGRTIDASHLALDGEFLCGAAFRSEGELRLRLARIGALHARLGQFVNPGRYALMAEGIQATTGLYLRGGFEAHGMVLLSEANVRGEINCTGGTFADPPPDQAVIEAEHLTADAVLMQYQFRAKGKVRLDGSTITDRLSCNGGRFSNKGDIALSANGVNCGEIRLGDGCVINGGVTLHVARIARELSCSGGRMCNPGKIALMANGLICNGTVYLNDGFKAEGTVQFLRARIATELNCTRGTFKGDRTHPALSVNGLICGGAVFLNDGFKAEGMVQLINTTIESELNCTNGRFCNVDDDALVAEGLVCRGSVYLNEKFVAKGKVLLHQASVARQLDCTHAKIDEFYARCMKVGTNFIWRPQETPKAVDVSHSHVGNLQDLPAAWPGRHATTLAGFAFDEVDDEGSSIDTRITISQRLDWLRSAAFAPDVYQRLVRIYQGNGHSDKARRIAIELQRQRRRQPDLKLWRDGSNGRVWNLGGPLLRLWNWFLDKSVSYGYAFHRLLLLAVLCWIVSWFLFTLAQGQGLMIAAAAGQSGPRPRVYECTASYPCFVPSIYSMELLLPVVNLRQVTYWLPDFAVSPLGKVLWYWVWAMIIFGWMMAIALAGGIGHLFSRRD